MRWSFCFLCLLWRLCINLGAEDVLAGAGGAREYSPIFPLDIGTKIKYANSGVNGKKIPPILWIAAVNSSETVTWEHIQREIKMNPKWTINIWDNADKDKFMREFFAGSSILWAYENVNPVYGGAAKADIVRLNVSTVTASD
jgi:hypothetical protein